MTLSRRTTCALLTLLILVDVAVCGWFATGRPNKNRGPDEWYSLRNVDHTLRTGELLPFDPYYPSLSALPQIPILGASHLLHRLTGVAAFAVLKPRHGVTPTGYLLSRWSVVLFGAGYLFLTFVIGRRLFSTETALLGVLLCMATPVHLRAVSIYKPDAILVLFVLLTFLWSLEAAEKGTLRAYLVAGLGVGLAASSKQTGALASIPLVVATLLHFRQAARWLRLSAAGLTSMLVFFVLNPYPQSYYKIFSILRTYVGWTSRHEDVQTGRHIGMALGFVPGRLVSRAFHGPLIGIASLLGFVALLYILVRRRDQRSQSDDLAIFVTFPISYALICAAISDFHRQNVFLSLVPFSSLAAGWLLHELWARASARLDPRMRRWAFWPALTALLIVVSWPAAVYVYTARPI
jgi:4-amino-4-deoxy-L-arabinose transferase-like glycosyltransferase